MIYLSGGKYTFTYPVAQIFWATPGIFELDANTHSESSPPMLDLFIPLFHMTFIIGSCVPCQFLVRGGANVAGKISLQPELILSMQGAEYEESEGFDGRFKINYLNVPVLAKHYVSEGLFVEVGPQVGLLLSGKDEYDTPISGEDDIKDELKSTDFGANIGLGYQFDSGLNVNARYNFGISDINDLVSPGFDFSNQNNVLAVGIGWRF